MAFECPQSTEVSQNLAHFVANPGIGIVEPNQLSPKSLTEGIATSNLVPDTKPESGKGVKLKGASKINSKKGIKAPVSALNQSSIPGDVVFDCRLTITDLPPALISEILNCLDPKDLGVVSCVSTIFQRLASEHHAWKQFYCERWGLPTASLALDSAEKIGLTSIRPFYGQNGSLEEVLSGLNFGSTQATIMNPGSYSHQSLNQQLRQVSETMQLLQLQLSEDTALQFTKSSIFFLSFGKEDYIDLFLHNSSSQMFQRGTQYFATILVNQMANAARYLYDANARKIICLGILPLGCTPRMAWELNRTSAEYYNGNGCVEHVNELVFEYNRLLDEQIVKLNTEFPDAQMVFCDVYNGMMEIINEPRLYGMFFLP
ncbi:GDSL esterase/lipase [Spatholobus suberectus]|nr:GDSL esterase/lipase [Spatholobus suberectus]